MVRTTLTYCTFHSLETDRMTTLLANQNPRITLSARILGLMTVTLPCCTVYSLHHYVNTWVAPQISYLMTAI